MIRFIVLHFHRMERELFQVAIVDEFESGIHFPAHWSIGFQPKKQVTCVSYSCDNTKIITGRKNGIIKIWKAKTEELIKTMEDHSSKINDIKFSANDRQIVSCSDDGSIKLWNANTGELVKTIELQHTIHCITFLDDTKIIFSDSDFSVTIMDLGTGSVVKKLLGHQGTICNLTCSNLF